MKTYLEKRMLIGLTFLLLVALSVMTMVFIQARFAPEAWDGTVATEFAGGDGSAENPFQIANGAQLAYLANRTAAANYLVLDEDGMTVLFNYREASYVLTADIVLNEGTFDENGTWSEQGTPKAWTPIPEFSGTFDGGGHIISGVYINGTVDRSGLFGYVLRATVQNVSLENCYVKGGACTGALAGEMGKPRYPDGAANKSFLANITVDGFVFGTTRVGGVAGRAYFTTLDNVTNHARVQGSGAEVGGVMGATQASFSDSATNTGSVTGTSSVGGIAGLFISDTSSGSTTRHRNAVNTGAVTGSGDRVGGLFGNVSNLGNHYGYFDNCANFGTVEGNNEVGGLVGYIRNASLHHIVGHVRGNLSLGTVTATGAEAVDVGILVGLATSSDEEHFVNVSYNYYFPMGDLPLVGPNSVYNLSENYAVTAEQLNGTATEVISETGTYANTTSVTTALNNFVWALKLTETPVIKTWTQGASFPEHYRTYAPLYNFIISGISNGSIEIQALVNNIFPVDFPLTQYNAGTNIIFTVTPNTGYATRMVSYSYKDSAGVTQTNPIFPDSEGLYTVEMPAAATTLALSFVSAEADVYSITYAACEGVTGWSSYAYPHHFAGYATVIPKPTKPGYIFRGWRVNDATEPVTDLTLGADDYTADITLTATWERKADIALDNDIQNSVYNGEGIAYVLTGTDAALPDYIISYLVGGEWTTEAPVNAGTYSVKLERDESAAHQAYSVELTGALVIDKAAGVVSNVSDIGRTYDGTAVSNPTYEMVGDGEISIAYYKGETLLESAPVNGGIYTVKVILSEGNNYYGTETTATFTIAKASLAGLLSWDYESAFSYDFIEKTVSVLGLPADVTPVYTANKATAAGEYVAKVSFEYNEDNYEPISLTDLTWTINKASLAGLISWDYESAFTYDGTLKTVSVLGLPGDVTVNYTDNTATGAGSYTAKAAFEYNTSNYEPFTIDDLSWTIEKATFNMSGVAWDYTTPFTYSGSAYTVALTGLPEGVSANYTDATKTGAGSYTATVTFTYDTDNYNTISFASL
ncbi:MAG: hypothetical protein WDA00_07555, partial [Eubacteriales bacterium]